MEGKWAKPLMYYRATDNRYFVWRDGELVMLINRINIYITMKIKKNHKNIQQLKL